MTGIISLRLDSCRRSASVDTDRHCGTAASTPGPCAGGRALGATTLCCLLPSSSSPGVSKSAHDDFDRGTDRCRTRAKGTLVTARLADCTECGGTNAGCPAAPWHSRDGTLSHAIYRSTARASRLPRHSRANVSTADKSLTMRPLVIDTKVAISPRRRQHERPVSGPHATSRRRICRRSRLGHRTCPIRLSPDPRGRRSVHRLRALRLLV